MAFTEYANNALLNLLDESVSGGGAITITSVQIGSGYPSGADNPPDFTGLKNWVQTLGAITSPSSSSGITSISDLVLYQSTVRFQVSSKDAPSTYQFNEYGIWASVGANAPVLILYATTGGPTGDTVTPSGTGTPVIRQKATLIGYSRQATTTTSLTLTNTVDLHAGTHLDNGVDPLPVSTTTRTGSLPRISGNPLDVLHGDLTWSPALLPGFLQMTAGTTAPPGWLMADGSAVSRVTYAALYGVIGTSYGSGDGVSTFNLPDLRGRVPLGAGSGAGLTTRPLASKGGEETHVLTIAELAVHNHGISDPGHAHGVTDPNHNHGHGDAGHAHSIADSGHAHGVADPGHQHGLSDMQYDHTNALVGNTCSLIGHAGTWVSDPRGPTDAALTGVAIYAAGTGIGIYAAATGVYNLAAATGISIKTSATGISTVNQGSGAGHNNVQPYLAINFLIHI